MCMFVYVCICVEDIFVCTHAFECMYVWKPEGDAGCLPELLFTLFTEAWSDWTRDSHIQLVYLVSPFLGIHLFQVLWLQVHLHACLLGLFVGGFWASVL